MPNIIQIGGGGGGSATLITKSITQDGTYIASEDNADGYSEVNVNVYGDSKIFDCIPIHSGKITMATGVVVADNDYYYTDLFSAPNGKMIFDLGEVDTGSYVGVEMCGSDGSHIDYWSASERYREVNHSSYYSQAPKLRLSFHKSYLEKVVLLDKVNGITYTGDPVIVGDKNGGGMRLVTDLIPTPTTLEDTNAFADSYYSSAQVDMRPWCAFDKTLTNYWASADGTNHYIGYKFENAVVVNCISMELRIDDPTYALGQAPTRWVVEGSNDDGTTWETVNESGYYWSAYTDSHTYDFENTTAYKWWRVRATSVQNGQRIFGLAELGFYNVSYVNSPTKYVDIPDFAFYYRKNTSAPTVTQISSNEVSLTYQDQNATGYELSSYSVYLDKGIYVAEIYATVDKNNIQSQYTWGIYSCNSTSWATVNNNSPMDNEGIDTYIPFNTSDTNEHYYEVPIKMLADGTAYICFATAGDGGINATITVRSLKIRRACGNIIGGLQLHNILTAGVISNDQDYQTATFTESIGDDDNYLLMRMLKDGSYRYMYLSKSDIPASGEYAFAFSDVQCAISQTAIRSTYYSGNFRNIYVDIVGSGELIFPQSQ